MLAGGRAGHNGGGLQALGRAAGSPSDPDPVIPEANDGAPRQARPEGAGVPAMGG